MVNAELKAVERTTSTKGFPVRNASNLQAIRLNEKTDSRPELRAAIISLSILASAFLIAPPITGKSAFDRTSGSFWTDRSIASSVIGDIEVTIASFCSPASTRASGSILARLSGVTDAPLSFFLKSSRLYLSLGSGQQLPLRSYRSCLSFISFYHPQRYFLKCQLYSCSPWRWFKYVKTFFASSSTFSSLIVRVCKITLVKKKY